MITGGIYPIPNSQFIHEIRNGASRDELINIVLTLAVRGEARENGESANMANVTDAVRHPAKYTDALLPIFARMAEGCQRILDPMAGTGKIFSLVRHGFAGEIHANELERDWAQQHPLTRVGNASNLPFPDGFFDGIVTSPVYGNRMCLAGGSLVLTEKGHIPIEEVVAGDMVLTHKGRWRKVLWSGCTGEQNVVEITGQLAGKLTCTAGHRFWASENRGKYWDPVSVGHPQWVTAAELKDKYWTSPCSFEPTSVPAMPALTSGIEYNDDFWWAVGFWLGNGWGYHSVAHTGAWRRCAVLWCTHVDKSNEAEEVLSRLFGDRLARDKSHTTGKVVAWAIYSQGLLKWLYEHFGKGAGKKTLPGWCLGLPESQRRELLNGYLFADGCEQERCGRDINIAVSTSESLLRGVQMLAQSLGGSTSFAQTKEARREWVVGQWSECSASYTARISWTTTKYTFQAGPDHVAAVVRSVEPLSQAIPVYDLEVEEDHSFVAEGVVVHNSDRFVPGEGWEEARKSRNTYTHALGRPLTSGNTGAMQWGPAYREAHIAIWREADRLLAPNGRIILNCSDHIRAGKVVPVTQWHIDTICSLGYTVTQREQVQTPRNGFGQNGKARVAYEEVIRMDKTAQGEEA